MKEPEYIEHDLIKAIAEDPHLGELEVNVSVEGAIIRLTGHVASQGHREDLVTLVRERFPDHEIADETETVDVPPPPTAEREERT